ncbi:MAG: NAD(P)H-hydrate dehydratase, partial [Betaproteobacteria bacterium]
LGARSPPPPPVAEAIGWINACTQAQPDVRVLSVDLPSGLHPDTGARLLDTDGQACAVRAHHTLSLLTLKPGLYTHEAGDWVGEVWFDALGVEPLTPTPPHAPAAHLVPTEALALLRSGRLQPDGQARASGHKGSFGDVWLVGGAPGMLGALRLASRAAVAAGAGRVHRVELQGGAAPGPSESHKGRPEPPGLVDELAPEVMTRTVSDIARASLAPAVVVAGCGGGTLIAPLLPTLLTRAWRLVLDADALNALAAEAPLWARLRARPHHGAHTVLTPHPLEAARLLGLTTAQVQSDRLAAAQRLADRSGATVVLKGAGTVVASPGQVPWINGSGNARLATGGTGDVLAGWIAGAWASTHAQRTSLHDVVAACVHLHGKAADHLEAETGRCRSLVLPASELIAEMSRELMRTGHGHQP